MCLISSLASGGCFPVTGFQVSKGSRLEQCIAIQRNQCIDAVQKSMKMSGRGQFICNKVLFSYFWHTMFCCHDLIAESMMKGAFEFVRKRVV
jgi:hypothetical protein